MAKNTKIDGYTYVKKNDSNPYGQIAKAYAKQVRSSAEQRQDAMKKQLDASRASTSASYDSNAAQAYVNQMKQRNALPEQLRAQGINGGASETALVNVMNNYAQAQAQNNASRAAALAQLQNTYDTNVANMNYEMEQDIAANNAEMAQAQAQYNDTMYQRAYKEFKDTLGGYSSIKDINNVINKLKKEKSNPYWKEMVWSLRERRHELGEELKEKKKKKK